MTATHIDYMHHDHLRVETGEIYAAWNAGQGFHTLSALCVAPGAKRYAGLAKKSLPSLDTAYREWRHANPTAPKSEYGRSLLGTMGAESA